MDIRELVAINEDMGHRESARDVRFFDELLAPAFAMRRANLDRAMVDRMAFLAALPNASTAERQTVVESVAFVGMERAVVACVVSMEGKRYHELRLFVSVSVRTSQKWQLLARVNELCNQTNAPVSGTGWNDAEALQLWKYFGDMGAHDKNTMISVETVFLGFSSALLGYLGTNLIRFNPLCVTDATKTVVLSVLGLVITGIAGFVALLYGGYSNRNWAMADEVARNRASVTGSRKWDDLVPDSKESVARESPDPYATRLAAKAWVLARPYKPEIKLASIFRVYWYFSVLFGLAFILSIILSKFVCKL